MINIYNSALTHPSIRIKGEDKGGREHFSLTTPAAVLMEDVPFPPLYTLAELYGVARNVIWKGLPDGKILAAEMKVKS